MELTPPSALKSRVGIHPKLFAMIIRPDVLSRSGGFGVSLEAFSSRVRGFSIINIIIQRLKMYIYYKAKFRCLINFLLSTESLG